jgi:trafficking protein particle complex subunit 2
MQQQQQPAAVGGGVACVALIGAQNQPLLLRPLSSSSSAAAAAATTTDDDDEERLRFSYIAHCALDALEEKVLLARRSAADAASAGPFAGGGVGVGGSGGGAYLGLLYPTERYRVYGYCAATHLKVVLVVEPLLLFADARGGGAAEPPPLPSSSSSSSWPRDADLSALCRRLHLVYVDAASNPFFVAGAPLEEDSRVTAGVDAALEEFSVTAAGAAAAAAAGS